MDKADVISVAVIGMGVIVLIVLVFAPSQMEREIQAAIKYCQASLPRDQTCTYKIVAYVKEKKDER